jgi:hypothetical protein
VKKRSRASIWYNFYEMALRGRCPSVKSFSLATLLVPLEAVKKLIDLFDPFETTRRPLKTRSLDLGAAAARGRLRRAGRPRRHRGDAYDQHEHSGTVSWRHRVEEASTPEVREVPPRSPFVCRLASLAASHARARRAASPEVAASFASHAAHLTCDHPHQRLRLWVREARGSLIRSCR